MLGALHQIDAAGSGGMVLALRTRAGRRVSGASLRFLRVVFGVVVLVSALRLLVLDWTSTLYSAPSFHFSYTGFGWVPVLPTPLFRLQVALIAVAALAVIFAYRYRFAILVLFVLFTWMEFAEATVYLNHYWFVSLMSALMIFLPLDSRGSWKRRPAPGDSAPDDSAPAGSAPTNSAPADSAPAGSVPVGAVWLVRFQVGVVYAFAGLAKLNTDWLLHGLPLALWLPGKSELPLIGGLLAHRSTAIALSWAGAAFDCTIVAFLLWRRTRFVAWLVVVAFHVATFVLFPNIGVFPFLMIGSSLIFFDPDWPQQVLPRLFGQPPSEHSRSGQTPAAPIRLSVLVVVIVWMSAQVLVPLRQYVIPGDARFSGEGFRFGWNVLAVERVGSVEFRVTDTTTGDTRRLTSDSLFTPQQMRSVASEPELIRQAAHYVAETEARRSGVMSEQIEVRVDAFVSVNGRAARRLIDPDANLAAEPSSLWHTRWILDGP